MPWALTKRRRRRRTVIYNENVGIKIGHLFHGSTFLVGLNLLIVEVSRSHSDTPHADTSNSDTPHSVGLLRTSKQLVADTST
jgi:hypothetical protein